MDNVFSNSHSIITPENNIDRNFDISNNGGLLSAEALKSMVNKRKLALTGVINEETIYKEKGTDGAKRLCTINGHQNEQKI